MNQSISSLEPLGLLRLRTPPPVATLALTLNTWILIGQEIYRFELISLTQVRKIFGIERLDAKSSKHLQNGTHDGTFFALFESDMKISKDCTYASYWETVRNLSVNMR